MRLLRPTEWGGVKLERVFFSRDEMLMRQVMGMSSEPLCKLCFFSKHRCSKVACLEDAGLYIYQEVRDGGTLRV